MLVVLEVSLADAFRQFSSLSGEEALSSDSCELGGVGEAKETQPSCDAPVNQCKGSKSHADVDCHGWGAWEAV